MVLDVEALLHRDGETVQGSPLPDGNLLQSQGFRFGAVDEVTDTIASLRGLQSLGLEKENKSRAESKQGLMKTEKSARFYLTNKNTYCLNQSIYLRSNHQ